MCCVNRYVILRRRLRLAFSGPRCKRGFRDRTACCQARTRKRDIHGFYASYFPRRERNLILPTGPVHLRHLGQKCLPRRSAASSFSFSSSSVSSSSSSSSFSPSLARSRCGAIKFGVHKRRECTLSQLSLRGLYFNFPVSPEYRRPSGERPPAAGAKENQRRRGRERLDLPPSSSHTSRLFSVAPANSPLLLLLLLALHRNTSELLFSLGSAGVRRPSRATLLRDVTYESTAI